MCPATGGMTERISGLSNVDGLSTLDGLSNVDWLSCGGGGGCPVDRLSTLDSLSNVAPNKEKLLKENIKRGGDASRCPDCMGTGFYYPEGTAKGVKRCAHKKLR